MKVPLVDLKAQYSTIRSEIREAIERVVESQHFILGPEVEGLEREIGTFCNARYAIGVSSGTDALLATLMAIGIVPGDEVVTSAYSFFATAGVIARLGARPIFVDIDSSTYNLDVNAVSTKITSKTRAILPVHLFGKVADIEPLCEMAKKKKIYVIEDAAQAIGSQDDKKRQAGTIGHVGCFSFFPTKNLGAFGDAGMVITNDDQLAETLRAIRVHGAKPKYHHSLIGGNFRLDALQAVILRVKLKHLTRWIEMRRHNASRYRSLFEEMELSKYVWLPEESPGHTYNQFVPRFSDRDRLRWFLREKGVETQIYYPVPLHLQACFSDLGYGSGDFPKAETAARDSLALPIYPEITETQQRYVVEKIGEFYR
jgi:dTDP-4-amino-4,6-dideoxygalactose transaminase